jgi:hypothetical protein
MDNDDSHPYDPNALPICGKDTGSPCESYAQELLTIMTRVLVVLCALVLLGAAHSQQQSPHTTYYIAAGGNNANDGLTPATAWADETNISRRVFSGQTTIAFNGTDTFTGCIHAKGSVNFRSTRTSMIRLTSYGNGLATLKPNCTAASAKIGIINVDRVDGLIIDRLHLVGDPAGKAGRCVSVTNSDRADHGNFWVERSVIEDCYNGVDDDFGGLIFFDQSKNNGAHFIDHINVLANILRGTHGLTSVVDNAITSYGYEGSAGSLQYDAVEGNLIYWIGGKYVSPGNAYMGNGVLIAGAGTGGGRYPYGALVLGNLVGRNGANLNNCGSRFAWWTFKADSVLIRQNGAFDDVQKGGCDGGGGDADIGSTNVTIERNHCEHEWGPCVILYDGGSMKWGPNVVRDNWSHDSAWGGQSSFSWNFPTGNGVGTFSHNYANQLKSGVVFGIAGGGGACGGPGSSVDHNSFMAGPSQNGVTSMAYIQLGYSNVACSGVPVFTANNWWPSQGGGNLWFRNGPTTTATTLTAWQNIAPGGDAGATELDLPSSAVIPSLGIILSATDKTALANAAALVAADPYVQQDSYIATRLPAVRAIANGTAQLTGPEVEDAVVFVLVWGSADPNACALLRRVSVPYAACMI